MIYGHRSRKEEQVPVWPRLLEMLEKRVEIGFERYGRLLTSNNDRDALMDAWEEAADLLMYLSQMLIEREQENKP